MVIDNQVLQPLLLRDKKVPARTYFIMSCKVFLIIVIIITKIIIIEIKVIVTIIIIITITITIEIVIVIIVIAISAFAATWIAAMMHDVNML